MIPGQGASRCQGLVAMETPLPSCVNLQPPASRVPRNPWERRQDQTDPEGHGGAGGSGSLGQIPEDLCGGEGRGPGPLGRPMKLVEATGGALFSNWDIWRGCKATGEHLVLFEYWFVKSLAIQLVM